MKNPLKEAWSGSREQFLPCDAISPVYAVVGCRSVHRNPASKMVKHRIAETMPYDSLYIAFHIFVMVGIKTANSVDWSQQVLLHGKIIKTKLTSFSIHCKSICEYKSVPNNFTFHSIFLSKGHDNFSIIRFQCDIQWKSIRLLNLHSRHVMVILIYQAACSVDNIYTKYCHVMLVSFSRKPPAVWHLKTNAWIISLNDTKSANTN